MLDSKRWVLRGGMNMNKDYEVVEFQKEYSMLNNRFLKVDKDLFDLGVLVAYTSELNRGFIVKKQLKTTSKGTKFNYKKIDSQEETDTYYSKVREMSKRLDSELVMKKFKAKIEQLEKDCK